MARRPLLFSLDAVVPTLWRRWRVNYFLRSATCAHDGSQPLCVWCHLVAGDSMGLSTADWSRR